MKLLMISTDRKIFEPTSEVRSRMVDLGKTLTELHIIVLAKSNLGLQTEKISENIYAYPTNSGNRLDYFRKAIKIGRTLAKPDLITAQDPFECGLIAWRLARYFKVELQLQIHTDFLNQYFGKESVLNKLRVELAKFLLPKANSVRVVSRRIADSLDSSGINLKQLPVVLPVKIDLEKIRSAPIKISLRQSYPQFNKIILMASRLSPEKQITLAIKAMLSVIKVLPKAGLIIVGSGPDEKNLKQQTLKFGLGKNIIFEPWSDDLPSYYKTSDLFLLTSLYEGYGRTVVEALACGCPVISTDVGVAREVGAIITDREPKILAEVILQELTKSNI